MINSFEEIGEIGGNLIPSHIIRSGSLYIPAELGGVHIAIVNNEIYVYKMKDAGYKRYVSIGKKNIEQLFLDEKVTTYSVTLQELNSTTFIVLIEGEIYVD